MAKHAVNSVSHSVRVSTGAVPPRKAIVL